MRMLCLDEGLLRPRHLVMAIAERFIVSWNGGMAMRRAKTMPVVPLGSTVNRDVVERVERCVATMVYYHKDGWSWTGAKLVMEEADSLMAWASMLGLGDLR